MTLRLIHWNTTDGPQIAVGDVEGDDAKTVVVLSETDADGETSGQISIFHNAKRGTEPGTWAD